MHLQQLSLSFSSIGVLYGLKDRTCMISGIGSNDTVLLFLFFLPFFCLPYPRPTLHRLLEYRLRILRSPIRFLLYLLELLLLVLLLVTLFSLLKQRF